MNVGYVLYLEGDLAGARPYCERALAIREEVLGDTQILRKIWGVPKGLQGTLTMEVEVRAG